MINWRIKKRIFYVPGLLTLAIAPIIFMARTNKYLFDRTQHCITIGVAEKDDSEFSKAVCHPLRAYQTFKLTENSKQDSSVLILIENYAKGLNLSKNDSIGLKVILFKNIKYATFIRLLNTCLKSGINNWIPWGDTLFIFHVNYPKQYGQQICQNEGIIGVGYGSDILSADSPKPNLTLIQKLKNEKEFIKLAVPFLSLISIMAYLSLKSIINEG
jgi:hypothetical protein